MRIAAVAAVFTTTVATFHAPYLRETMRRTRLVGLGNEYLVVGVGFAWNHRCLIVHSADELALVMRPGFFYTPRSSRLIWNGTRSASGSGAEPTCEGAP